MSKPHPDIYLAAARELDVRPGECVFVDDKPANVEGARAVGMIGVRFVTAEQVIEDIEVLLADQ